MLLARRWEAARAIWAARSRSLLALRACCFHWRNCWNFKEYWQNRRAFLRSSTSLLRSLRTSCLSLRYWHHLKKYLVLTWTSSLISISPSSYRICSSSPTYGSTFCSCYTNLAKHLLLKKVPMCSKPTSFLTSLSIARFQSCWECRLSPLSQFRKNASSISLSEFFS